jgi:LysM repeat protein
MKDDPELQMDDAWSDGRAYSPKRRETGSGSSRYLRILMVILLVLIIGGGILYFLGKRPTGSDATLLQSKMTALEQRIAGLEKQIAELHGKISTSSPDPALLQRVDALSHKVEALDRQKKPTAEPKAKPPTPSKPTASAEKKYHMVLRGETLYGISKKYGMSVGELQKLNNLSKDPSLRTGQKLLVSPGR